MIRWSYYRWWVRTFLGRRTFLLRTEGTDVSYIVARNVDEETVSKWVAAGWKEEV